MTRLAETLGTAPPTSLDAIVAGLTRARRLYDADSETEQSRSFASNALDAARVQLIDALREWVAAGLRREAALDAGDALDVEAKAFARHEIGLD